MFFGKVSIFQQTTTPMNNDYRSPAFKKWLDKLQQESWQLELIISGFSIYALMMAYEPIEIGTKTAEATKMTMSIILWSIVGVMWSILIFNLILHVILRGLWIGAVGLRYVSGDIDYNVLKYSDKFTKYLKKNVGSFDKYIGQLEKYCSVLFAISFLLIFYMLSIYIITFSIVGIGYLISEKTSISENETFGILFGIGLLLFLFFSLIVFIDFIGQGILKKNKWIAKIYFPIYWLFGYLTLSFLYRPLIYNFLDNKFGKRLVLFLVPIYLLITIISGVQNKVSNYAAVDTDSWENYANSRHYEDEQIKEIDFIQIAAIPSKVIENSFLKVFILLDDTIEDNILETNKSLVPENDNRGINLGFMVNYNKGKNVTIKSKKSHLKNHEGELQYLKTFKALYVIKIDSILLDNDFIISTDKHKRLGFETYLNIRDLKEGKHLLRILAPVKDSSNINQDTLVTIPFWHYKN